MSKTTNSKMLTQTGHPLTANESKFIDAYIQHGNGTQAVIDAGYKSKNPVQ